MQQRWQQADGQRHILPSDILQLIAPGTSFRTLCRRRVTPTRDDFPELGGNWFAWTCMDCEKAWFTVDAATGGQ